METATIGSFLVDGSGDTGFDLFDGSGNIPDLFDDGGQILDIE